MHVALFHDVQAQTAAVVQRLAEGLDQLSSFTGQTSH